MTTFFNNNVSDYNIEKINKQNFLLLYTKFIIRSKNKYKLNIIDESNKIITSGIQTTTAKGCSLILQEQNFCNIYYHNLKFTWLQKNTGVLPDLPNFSENLANVTSLLILNSNKKGFLIYTQGFKGVLKIRDVLQIFTQVYNKFKTNVFNLLISINKKNFTSKYILIRFPCRIKSYILHSIPVKNNFSRLNRKNIIKNKINLKFTLNTKTK